MKIAVRIALVSCLLLLVACDRQVGSYAGIEDDKAGSPQYTVDPKINQPAKTS